MLNWLPWIPRKIPIKREEDYHTHYTGTTNDGKQFFGYTHYFFSDDADIPNTPENQLLCTVLYIFDKKGNFLSTKHSAVEIANENVKEDAARILDKFIGELGHVTFQDIKVKPFQTLIDGHIFGLVPYRKDHTVDLEPGSAISFQAPWNGEYDT